MDSELYLVIRNSILFFTLSILLFGCNVNDEINSVYIPKRVVIIGLDGLSVEGFQESKHPNIDKLLNDGLLSLNTRCVSPSITLPNWTSHFTSSGPEQHGVMSNDWNLDNFQLPPLDYDKSGYFPSIFKILKDEIPHAKTAFYYNWANLINSLNKEYFDEISFEENDQFSENYQKAYNFISDYRTDPMLIFLYSVHIDHAGHRFNWMSEEYLSSIEVIDLEIGKLIDRLKFSDLYDDTNFLLITDHGGRRNTPRHGGLSIEEMEVPWAITGPNIKRGNLNEANSVINTARIISLIFGLENIPKSWVGNIPQSIFE